MRSRINIQSVILISIALYILQLGFQRDLNLYIHPRYIIFTIVMTAIGLILFIGSYIAKQDRSHDHKTNQLAMIPIWAMLVFALFVPAKPLTSSTVSQRITDTGSIVTTNSSKPINTLFAGSSKNLKLEDWSRLLASNNDASFYINKPAKISGFIYDAQLGDDVVWLARFVVTCCAVDAQPIGAPVYIEGWRDTYEQDQWLEVEGEFTTIETTKGSQQVLKPDNLTVIDQPRSPYAN